MTDDKIRIMTIGMVPKNPEVEKETVEKETIKKTAYADTNEHIKKHSIIGETPKKPKPKKEVSKNNSKDNKKDNN